MEKMPAEQTPDTSTIEPKKLDLLADSTEKSFILPQETVDEPEENSHQSQYTPQTPTTHLRPLTDQAKRAKEYLRKFRDKNT